MTNWRRTAVFIVLMIAINPSVQSAEPPPSVDEILQNWEKASSEIKTLDVQFKQYSFDRVFEIEHRATGRFYFEGPDKGRLEFRPLEISRDEISVKKNSQGKPYLILSRSPETWIWTGSNVIRVNEADKTFEEIAALKQHSEPDDTSFRERWASHFSRPQDLLPFVVDIHADQLQREFTFSMVKMNDNYFWLCAEPRTRQAAARFEKVDLHIDRSSYAILKTKITWSGGDDVTYYLFSNMQINAALQPDDNPLELNREKYRKHLPIRWEASHPIDFRFVVYQLIAMLLPLY